MNPLQQDFDRLRCAGTPWCLILSPDYRECMRSLCKLLTDQDDPPSLWAWDCLQGHRCLSEASLTSILGSPDDTVQAPALLLKKVLDLRPDQDDGVSPTHHSYVWEPDSAVTKARLAAGAMPELHVWAAIPDRGEIIDMTTRYWPEQCWLSQQRDWPGNKPPTYFWGTAKELPEGVLYAPDIRAIALALHLLKGELP